jgi:hypothetical protein
MAEKLSRNFLSALGIEEDKATVIVERHREIVDEITTERDTLKEKADQLAEVQKQLNKYKKAEEEAEKNAEKDPYKVKYEAIKEEFENYKKDIQNKEITAKKTEAYKKLLKDAGVSEKRIEAVLKVSNIDSLEFDDEGKVKEADKLTESIKTEWSDFIQTDKVEGATTANPPTTTKTAQDLGKLSMADYIKARKTMND